jgi:probable O-glycosylation ligase (exosortase A-associated)
MQTVVRNIRSICPFSLRFTGIVGLSVLFGVLCLILPVSVVLGICVVLILALTVMIYPFLGILGIVLLDYVRITHFVPALTVIHPNLIMAIWVLLSWAIHVSVFKRTRVFLCSQVFLLGGLILIMTLSYFEAVHKVAALNQLRSFAGYAILCFLIIQTVSTPRRVKAFLLVFLTTNAILAFIAFPKLFFHYDIIVETTLGLGDFLGDGNDFALALNVAIPLAFFLLWAGKSIRIRAFAFGILVMLVANVVLSGSRGGTVALASIAVFSLFKVRKRMFTLILVIIFVGGILILAPARYFDRMATISGYEEDASAQGRIFAWKAGIEMALDHPLVGVGPGNFSDSYQAIYRPPLARVRSAIAAHSVYFQILGELGFPGILCLLLFVLFNLRDNRRTRRSLVGREDDFSRLAHTTSLALDVSLIAFLVGGTFLSAGYYPHFYVITGMIAALRNTAQNSAESEQKVGGE